MKQNVEKQFKKIETQCGSHESKTEEKVNKKDLKKEGKILEKKYNELIESIFKNYEDYDEEDYDDIKEILWLLEKLKIQVKDKGEPKKSVKEMISDYCKECWDRISGTTHEE